MKLKDLAKKTLRIIRQNFSWIIALVMLIIALGITEELYDNEIYRFDNDIYKYVAMSISPGMTAFLKIFTNLGSAPVVIVLCILAFIFFKRKIYGALMALNLAVVAGLNVLIKDIVQRPRPTGYRIVDETGYSFPSGHSMVSMAFYGFLIYLVYRYIKHKTLRTGLIVLLSLIIALIGISRIYLGVHYASDVAEGFCVSIVYLIIATKILSRNKILTDQE